MDSESLDLTQTPPTNRADLCEALKEFYVLFGRKAVRMVVPIAVYVDWISMPNHKNEWGGGLSDSLTAMPPTFFECELLLHANTFRLE